MAKSTKAKIEEVKKELKDTKLKVSVRNLKDPGDNIQFSFSGKFFDMKDGCEVILRKEVVDHLNSVVLKKTLPLSIRDGEEKKYSYTQRILCTVLETIEE